jgi:hypothetical protein
MALSGFAPFGRSSAPLSESRNLHRVNRLHRFPSRPWGADIPLRKLFLVARNTRRCEQDFGGVVEA